MVLLLVIILLVAPVIIKIDVSEAVKITAKYLLIRIRVYPRDLKSRMENAELPAEKQPPASPKKTMSDLIQSVQSVWDYIAPILTACKKLIRGSFIKPLDISVEIGDEDAAQTAISYGKMTALIYNIFATLNNIFDIYEPKINITPVFDKKILKFRIICKIQIRMYIIISILFLLFIRLALLQWNRKKKVEEGGAEK